MNVNSESAELANVEYGEWRRENQLEINAINYLIAINIVVSYARNTKWWKRQGGLGWGEAEGRHTRAAIRVSPAELEGLAAPLVPFESGWNPFS